MESASKETSTSEVFHDPLPLHHSPCAVVSSWIVEITLRLQLYTMVDVQTSH